jgi:hypothetical protein
VVGRVSLSLVLVTLALGGPAWAQGDGVTVDPDSPPGQEYALPLEAARGQTAPREPSATVPAAAPAPAFGAGVTVQRRTTAAPERRGARRPVKTAEPAEVARIPAAERAATVTGDGATPVLWSALAAAGLIAVGFLVAGLWRRVNGRR